MTEFLKRLIPKNIAALIGIISQIVPLLREVLIGVVRIIAVFVPAVETWISVIENISDQIMKVIDFIKRSLLGMENG